MQGGTFQDCVQGTGQSFAMALSSNGTTGRALGYATMNGTSHALVFEVTDIGGGKYGGRALNTDGTPVFQFNIQDGHVTDVQALGPMGCSGVYLGGMLEVGLATASFGPIGFAVGMAGMLIGLSNANCL
jgi:hypothetical protein